MPITLTAESELLVGTALVVEAQAPEEPFVAVFEDDGDTGYFYAVDPSADDNPIQNALHIYNAADVADRETPSEVKIGWSQDSKKVVLLINGYPHAIFDFEAKRGYCRTGFPPAPENSPWGLHGHAWSDAAVDLFA
ncbi:DUF2251 domain-containing protein [Xanthomonas sp. NCPPB 3005]|uniref:DUF2251 domain-containing protein n=1 Tax=Xanthomonas sp. NCPPB 3005 TaxID=3240913 RepID=UPI0035128B7F